MRFLHTSITVKDLDRSIAFYTDVLGLTFERRRKIPENRAEIAFVVDPESGARIELTHWDDKPAFEAGDQLDHLAFEVADLDAVLAQAKARGATVAKEPFRLQGGSGRLAFILDPNEVWIELIEHPPAAR